MASLTLKKSLYVLVIAFVCVMAGCDFQQDQVSEGLGTLETANHQPGPGGMVVTSTPTFPVATPARPTQAPRDASGASLIDFMKGNGGCELPCLLGLSPGAPRGLEMQQFQIFFQSVESAVSSIPGRTGAEFLESGVYVQLWEGDFAAEMIFEHSLGRMNSPMVLNASGYQYVTGTKKTTYDSSFFSDVMGFYSLHNILTNHGMPSRVLVATY